MATNVSQNENARASRRQPLVKRSSSMVVNVVHGGSKRAPLAISFKQNKVNNAKSDTGETGALLKPSMFVRPNVKTRSVTDENAIYEVDSNGVQTSNNMTCAGKYPMSKVPVENKDKAPAKKSSLAAVSKIPKFPLTRKSTVADFVLEEQAPGYSSNLLPANVENIDINDGNNVLLTPDYVNEIYHYLRHLEGIQCVKESFLSVQREMTPKMRSVLVDWLINVHYQFRLLPETLYLGISIMDRFLQKEVVSKDKIQLVGVTTFFIASKFEEIYPPDIKDFVVICDQLYSKRDIIKMEMAILKSLKFELGRPLPLHFLRRNSKAAHADSKIHALAKYLMELTLVEYECAHWHPSLLAAVALYVTLKILDETAQWTTTLAHYSNYSQEQLIPHAALLCKIIKKSEKSKFQNCRKKYSAPKLMEISKISHLKSPIIDEMASMCP